jgi:hypothetical protein
LFYFNTYHVKETFPRARRLLSDELESKRTELSDTFDNQFVNIPYNPDTLPYTTAIICDNEYGIYAIYDMTGRAAEIIELRFFSLK